VQVERLVDLEAARLGDAAVRAARC
jgi:hypothetical protein